MEAKSYTEFTVKGIKSNPHIQTIAPHLFRKIAKPDYKRERITLSDGDFLDIDWVKNASKKLCIILHGLESSSHREYIYGIISQLTKNNYDALAMNYRGCSGETNLAFKAYNSGNTEDLQEVLNHITPLGYSEINIIGYSLGGNITLKYAGECGKNNINLINKFVGVSVPCDLEGSSNALNSWGNGIYSSRFLKSFKEKMRLKAVKYPDLLDLDKIESLSSISAFDDLYTAPSFGYKNASDYYTKCSSKGFIPFITRPTLIISAKDDPFLSDSCMPIKECAENNLVTFLNPDNGGHVGFMKKASDEVYWHEKQIITFLTEV